MHILVFTFLLTLIPTAVFAATGDFEPLVYISGIDYQVSGDRALSNYINAVFNIIITLAAMIAVIRVIVGGFQYMTTEAVGAKGEARLTIQSAVFGLILLGGSWLILNTINPQILSLSALNFSSLQPNASTTSTLREREVDRAQRLQELVNRDVDLPFFSEDDALEFIRECRRLGGVPSNLRKNLGINSEGLRSCTRSSTRECHADDYDTYSAGCVTDLD